MLYLTSFSISRDETKQNINGAFIENIEGGLTRIVTTDGYRLSIVDADIGAQLTFEEGIIIPQKAILEINKLLHEKRESQTIRVLYENNNYSGNTCGVNVIEFEPRLAKQIRIVAKEMTKLKGSWTWGYAFSIGDFEVRDPKGNNLALVSKGSNSIVFSQW